MSTFSGRREKGDEKKDMFVSKYPPPARDTFPVVAPDWDPRNSAVGSPFGSKSYLGLPFSDSVSTVQKAVRRCLRKEAQQWAADLYFSGTKGLRTNTANRLRVMAVEDVAVADPMLVLIVDACIAAEKHAPHCLWYVIAADMLARAKKTRVSDWMTGSTFHIQGKIMGEPSDLCKILDEGIREKNREKMWWAADALFQWKKLDVIKMFYTHPAFHGNEYVRQLGEIGLSDNWYADGKHRLILTQITLLWCENQMPNQLPASVGTEPVLWEEIKRRGVDIKECLETIDAVLRRDYTKLLGIPDYAYDKHTSKGKKMGRGLAHFIYESSLLDNESEFWAKLSKYFLDTFWIARLGPDGNLRSS